MIGALVALLSLDMTRKLVAAGAIAATLSVTGATNATPIVATTTAPHKFVRPMHAVVSGVLGNTAANGTWVLTPVDATRVTLTTFSAQGAVVNSVGNGDYTSGGTAQIGFPDGSILLGRRNVAMATSVVSPRIVFVPLGSPTWDLSPYGGVIPTGYRPQTLSGLTSEQQTMILQRQLATEQQQFEVHVTGCANPPDPDFGDFDVTQSIYQSLFASMFNMITPARAKVLRGTWVSQKETIQTLDSRGQKWVGLIEISQPVVDATLAFVPTSTDGTIIVNFADGSTDDEIVISVP